MAGRWYPAPLPPAFESSHIDNVLIVVNTAHVFEQFNAAVLQGRIGSDGAACISLDWAKYWRKCFQEAMNRLRCEQQANSQHAPAALAPTNASESLENRVKELEEMVSKLMLQSSTSTTTTDSPPSSIASSTTAAAPAVETPTTSAAASEVTATGTTFSAPTLTPTTTTASETESTPPSAQRVSDGHISYYSPKICGDCGHTYPSGWPPGFHQLTVCPGKSGNEEN
ncbi:hypothetical protein QBC40DRAFT_251868 [Triangularia verruculosa]|uniref:Uncharacterized protein n=1 Tax=Triangularia verruculosa TaxID=2587418 RepID=A0AAN7AVH5_9PEZI|nr:hypothetical protein QBC40DRAFT_251868 [Triangularia verruculosa]